MKHTILDTRHNFENLQVYHRSHDLAVSVLTLSQLVKIKSYRILDQLCASSISIPSNIAEGCERGSNKELKYFLRVASGSASELQTQLSILKHILKDDTIVITEMIDK